MPTGHWKVPKFFVRVVGFLLAAAITVLIACFWDFWREVAKKDLEFWEKATDKTLFGVVCAVALLVSVWTVRRIHLGTRPTITEIKKGWANVWNWLLDSVAVLLVWA